MTEHTHSPATPFAVLFQTIALLVIGGFLVGMYLRNALSFYIRPDYFLFTLITGGILIGVGSINLLLFLFQLIRKNVVWGGLISTRELINGISLSFLLISALFLPHRGLSSFTATRRGISQNVLTASNVRSSDDYPQENPLFLTANSSSFTIVDWVRSFSVNPEPEDYRDKSVQVEGFVQPNDDGTFTVARFVISCCAVDATPIGLIVDQQMESLKADDWVHVEGKFSVKEIKGVRKAIISPAKVEKIASPKSPYLY